jgi:hypothetical protein
MIWLTKMPNLNNKWVSHQNPLAGDSRGTQLHPVYFVFLIIYLCRIITLLFSSLIGSTFLSAVLITPAILLQFYWYKPSPTESKQYQLLNIQSWLFWAAANILISWYLAVIVDIIPHITRFAVDASWGQVNEFVQTRLGMYESVKVAIKPLLYAASAWASWSIIFDHIFHLYDGSQPEKSRAQYTRRVHIQFLQSFFSQRS